jgi:hypothetical protein
VRRIVVAVERLHAFPESGRIVPERNAPNIREVIVSRYRVVYRLGRDAVEIATVFRGDLADKAYLFADPFTRPVSFNDGLYKVSDPSFDDRPTSELVREFAWMRERVLQIRLALLGDGGRLAC